MERIRSYLSHDFPEVNISGYTDCELDDDNKLALVPPKPRPSPKPKEVKVKVVKK